MATFTGSDDLQGAEFVDADLRGARFVGANLSGAVMRGVQVEDADIDAPWLLSGESSLLVNGVDVTPYVEAELNRRFPGRAEQRAEDPEGLRSSAPGPPRSTASRRCPPARWTSRWRVSGRSRRRCDIWSWPRTRGSAAGS